MNTHETTFGDILKRERTNRGLSLRELAEISTIEASYINRLEKGNRDNPGFVTVCALANALELNDQEIIKSFGFERLGSTTNSNSSTQASEYSEVVSLIHEYVTAEDNAHGYISNIISKIEQLRANQQTKVSH